MYARIVRGLSSVCLVMALAAFTSGCSDKAGSASSGSPPPADSKPMKAPDKMGGHTAAPAPQPAKQTAAAPQPRKTEAPAKVDPSMTQARTEPAKVSPPPETPAQPTAMTDDEKRSQAEDLIYAQIRVKMEEAIQKRANLLKSGRNPADEEVRQLEGVIMRARQLLTEAGEVVEDVQPPIVQTAPKQ